MKKLMIAAAIVCAAAVSQGASILWGGDIAESDGQSAVGAGSVAYLIRGATAAEAAVAVITVDGTDWSAWTTDTGAKMKAQIADLETLLEAYRQGLIPEMGE